MSSDRAGCSRVVCYHHKQWFLLVYDWMDDIIITFLPPNRDALRSAEKKTLRESEVYNRIADDAFGVLSSTPISRCVYGQETEKTWGVKLCVTLSSHC
ncbi:MAG: hypothetical protein ACRC46_05780 [Thermoguttaceae bacterium]